MYNVLLLLTFYFIIYIHILILFITICLFILLNVSIAKIKKEGTQNIIFDLKRYYWTSKTQQSVLYNFKNFKGHWLNLIIFYLTLIVKNVLQNLSILSVKVK